MSITSMLTSINCETRPYLALQKIINETHKREGKVENPISFSSYELLLMLGHSTDGRSNFKHIEEWLDRMYATTIESGGPVFYAGQKHFAKERMRVFDRAVSVGRELETGVIAERNYVWLSAWQLENINSNHLIPVDFDTYRAMKNPIAKVLVPLLQIWLYAARGAQCFEKRYEEFCQILGVKQYANPSTIKQKLGPALMELQDHGYLAGWDVEKSKHTGDFKVVLEHGDKFYRDLLVKPEAEIPLALSAPPEMTKVDEELVGELTAFGIKESAARKLLTELPVNQPVRDQLDYLTFKIANEKGKIRNQAGYVIVWLRANINVPGEFETRRMRRFKETTEDVIRDETLKTYELEQDYDEYVQNAITLFLENEMDDAARTNITEQARTKLVKDFPYILKWKEIERNRVIECEVRKKVMTSSAGWPPNTTGSPGSHQNRMRRIITSARNSSSAACSDKR